MFGLTLPEEMAVSKDELVLETGFALPSPRCASSSIGGTDPCCQAAALEPPHFPIHIIKAQTPASFPKFSFPFPFYSHLCAEMTLPAPRCSRSAPVRQGTPKSSGEKRSQPAARPPCVSPWHKKEAASRGGHFAGGKQAS